MRVRWYARSRLREDRRFRPLADRDAALDLHLRHLMAEGLRAPLHTVGCAVDGRQRTLRLTSTDDGLSSRYLYGWAGDADAAVAFAHRCVEAWRSARS